MFGLEKLEQCDYFFLFFFVSYSGWHTLPSHASTEACPMRNPREGTTVVLRNTIRLT